MPKPIDTEEEFEFGVFDVEVKGTLKTTLLIAIRLLELGYKEKDVAAALVGYFGGWKK